MASQALKREHASRESPGKRPRRCKRVDEPAGPVDRKKKCSRAFTWFLKVYKGLDDWHIPIFRAVRGITGARHVLYPGSDKHITASLVFESVVYVDYNPKVKDIFTDQNILEWVRENKDYKQEAKVKFLCKNFESKFESVNSFDLLISSCAGIVSTSCEKYLKPGGYFLASDAHYDARTLFINDKFKLVGVYNGEEETVETSAEALEGHFTTTRGTPLTPSEVRESGERPKARRSFKLKREAWFYLFRKIT